MKRIILTAIVAFVALSASAQINYPTAANENDFRARVGASVSKGLGRHFEIGLEEELRLKNNLKSVDRIYSTIGISYKPTDWLKIEPQYTLINIWHDEKTSTNDEKYWDLRHRVAVNFTGTVKVGQWKFSLRERPQLTIRTDSLNSMEKVKNQMVLRSRLQAEYSFRRFPVKPYAFVEVTNTLNTPDRFEGYSDKTTTASYKLANYISKIRYSAGVKYRFDRRSSIDIFYRLDTGKGYDIHITANKGYLKSVTKEPYSHHIIGVFYNYNF